MQLPSSKLAQAVSCALLTLLISQGAHAALGLDRTRVIINGTDNTTAMSVTNQNKDLPYLAQAWIEDENGNKINSPIIALPPLQRVEPGAKTQVKVQAVGGEKALPQDRESLYFFNLREIPPKSSKANTLQLALQSRIKLFYRPASLVEGAAQGKTPWQEKITLERKGSKYIAHNPTSYYVVLSAAAPSVSAEPLKKFEAITLAPKSDGELSVSAASLGNHPVLTYINDYGGRPQLIFTCSGSSCKVTSSKAG